MPRFFADKEEITENSIVIKGQDAFHIARSLRMAVGDALTVSDGEGVEYSCLLETIRDEECTCKILSSARSEREPSSTIILYMAYPKADKLETVIQKAVELGASRIVPFESSRCIKRPSSDKAEKNTVRLNKIAKEAAKQCGRAIIPSVDSPLKFSDMIADTQKYALRLFCYEGEGMRSLKDVLSESQSPDSIAVIVGSEGGFSPEEAKEIIGSGAVGVNLGPRILRCETAPAYALASISYHFEL